MPRVGAQKAAERSERAPYSCAGCGKTFQLIGPYNKHTRHAGCDALSRHTKRQVKSKPVDALKAFANTLKTKVRSSLKVLDGGAKNKTSDNASSSKANVAPTEDEDWFAEPPSPIQAMPVDDSDPAPLPPPPPPPSSRPKRVSRPSWKVRVGLDTGGDLPDGPGDLPEPDPPAVPSTELAPQLASHLGDRVRSAPNRFGLSRTYLVHPQRIPDADATLKTLAPESPPSSRLIRPIKDIIYPYPNLTSFLFNRYIRRPGREVSQRDRKDLQELLLDKRFHAADLKGVNFDILDKEVARDPQSPWDSNGWKSSPLIIEVPKGVKPTLRSTQEARTTQQRQRRHGALDLEAQHVLGTRIKVCDVNHRSLVQIMKEACAEHATAPQVHFEGFEENWKPPYAFFPTEPVYGEAYQSPEWVEEQQRILELPSEPDCDLPRGVFGIGAWSDATHLAQFGQAKAWPIYAMPMGLSKYTRCKPSERVAQYVAFVPPLGDDFPEKLRACGITPTPALLTHCKREAFQGVWVLLLNDDEFRHAYVHGIVVDCSDGIRRRLYPRIFTYSADYPEKVLIATIKDMGTCPCPRCCVKKADFRNSGLPDDRQQRVDTERRDNAEFRLLASVAHLRVYKDGLVPNSTAFAADFMARSYVPTLNAFSEFSKSLSLPNAPHAVVPMLDIFRVLSPDFMHEFELGVWKSVLIHLIRILHSIGDDQVAIFDSRFRKISPFGRDTIRRFTHDVSALRKLAARDYENILQCCIPCFEGLFGAHDADIQTLLYLLSYWHALAKLRKMSATPVKVLEIVTLHLTNALRHFADVVCPTFPNTKETDREYRARRDAQLKRAAPGSVTTAGGKLHKTFNLNTYKFHALPDYPDYIRRFGTTDSYSTQAGELAHRLVKQHYARTNRRDPEAQIINLDAQQRVHERMSDELAAAENAVVAANTQDDGGEVEVVNVEDAILEPYFIAKENAHPINLYTWFRDEKRTRDAAYANFVSKLKTHLLARELNESTIGVEPGPSYSKQELLDCVYFRAGRIYEHATARFNYTTYDVLRAQDTVNSNSLNQQDAPRSHDVMLHSKKGSRHPFCYARVLGVFHADVYFFDDLRPQRREFLFVRWFELDDAWHAGPAARRLERVRYVPSSNPAAFGFLDPSNVVRACHLLPVFALGTTPTLLSMSFACDEALGDYKAHYVSRFVDRDMCMRHLGWGIGHLNPPDFPHEAFAICNPEVEHGVARLNREQQPSMQVQGREEDEEDDPDKYFGGGDDGSGSDTDDEMPSSL